MKLEFKRELDHNYLVLEEEQAEPVKSFEIYMLEENRIPGLLHCTMQGVNQQQRFYYEVTSKQSLDLLLERKRLSYMDLVHILKGIQTAISGAREYLLDVNHLMMRPEYMYLNLDLDLPEFCYFPYYERPVREQFFELAEYLLGKLDRQDRSGVELGYEIYKMASEENCSIEEILRLQGKRPEERSGAGENIRLSWEKPQEPAGFKIAEPSNSYGMEQKKKQAKKAAFWKRRKKEPEPSLLLVDKGGSFLEQPPSEEQEWAAPRGETSLLSEGQERKLVLYSMNPAVEPLSVIGEHFLIGKKKDAVDGYINHPTVSRIHARIEKREQGYYVTDLNSTNGTYLNARLLEPSETAQLRIGDVVRFADIEYTVGN
ncbi:MAG: FHA domain-containing protein [Lachnospiraceae bacterium]|nr:FHA domain-containing protein [Lachnospiraceae bacterium]